MYSHSLYYPLKHKRKHRIRLHQGRTQRADEQQPSHAPIISTADKALDALLISTPQGDPETAYAQLLPDLTYLMQTKG